MVVFENSHVALPITYVTPERVDMISTDENQNARCHDDESEDHNRTRELPLRIDLCCGEKLSILDSLCNRERTNS
jgi:hypothetical protein